MLSQPLLRLIQSKPPPTRGRAMPFLFHEDTLIFRFHELRLTFATLALQNGVDIT